MKTLVFTAASVVLAASSMIAAAAVPPEKAKMLGKQLTPLGGITAGNDAGTIPAWDGGIKSPPEGWRRDEGYIDPYRGESARIIITQENYKQYADNLTDGHQALFQRYPSYSMLVYQTHRSAAFPKQVYRAARKNALSSTLENLAPQNAAVAVPFPIPNNGAEAIWNHLTRYRGESVRRWNVQIAVQESGARSPAVKMLEEVSFNYGSLGMKPSKLDNGLLKFLQTTMAPTRLAGQVLILHDTIDQTAGQRQAWTTSIGQRRVHAAPQIGYDNPGQHSEGMRTIDQADMFNGPLDRYDWRYVGRQEAYVPYNSYRLNDRERSYDDIIRPKHPNQDLARYELHRVHVVEATLKPGLRHLYMRRVFYIDEDSWQIVGVDVYDNRNQLWKVQEAHSMNAYDVPAVMTALEVIYDLQSRRYLLQAMNNEEPLNEFNVDFAEDHFAAKPPGR